MNFVPTFYHSSYQVFLILFTALATLSLLVNDPQILEHWVYAHEVHLDKCNRARDFCLEF